MKKGFEGPGGRVRNRTPTLSSPEPLNPQTLVERMPRFTPEQLIFVALAALIILGLSVYRMFFLY
jgi:hypothetical protein